MIICDRCWRHIDPNESFASLEAKDEEGNTLARLDYHTSHTEWAADGPDMAVPDTPEHAQHGDFLVRKVPEQNDIFSAG